MTIFKKIIQAKLLYNIVFFLCIVLSLIFSISAINDLLNYDGNLAKYSSNWNNITKVLQNFIFFTLFIHFFIEFKFKNLIFLIPLSFLEQDTNFFSKKVHFFLLNENIYSIFSSQPYEISPEYPRIIFFFILLIFSFILLFFKKFRKITVIMLFFSALSVFATAILFHTITIKQINYFTTEQEKTITKLSNLSNLKEVEIICLVNDFTCLFNDKNSSSELFNNKDIPNYIKDIQLSSILPYYKNNEQYFYYSVAVNPSERSRLLGRIPYAVIKNNNIELILLDFKHYNNYLIFNQMIFAVLAMTSHLVWIFGALYLIYFHKKKRAAMLPNL